LKHNKGLFYFQNATNCTNFQISVSSAVISIKNGRGLLTDIEISWVEMRILVISNLYPPHHAGGYELASMEMVENLKARGHDIIVLTSTYGEDRVRSEGDVHRWLMLRFERGVISLVSMAHEMGLPTCYYVFDNWLATWEMDHWCQLWRQGGKGLYHLFLKFLSRKYALVVPPFSLDMSSAVFATSYLKSVALKVGKPVEGASVVHWGIDINNFPYQPRDSPAPNRLLYVGQIVPHKGIQTVIEALGVIKRSQSGKSLSFTIVGDYNAASEYTVHLKDIAEKCGVDDQVDFAGPVSRENLPEVYQSHHILVFPSLWDEPFGITQLEAMSSGLAVVGTGTGGSAEILENGTNGLTYSKGDAAQCAHQISRLLENGSFFNTLRRNGRKTVEKKFRIDKTVNLMEMILAETHKMKRTNKKVQKIQTTSMGVKKQEFETEVARYQKRLRFIELGCQTLQILNPLRWARSIITRAGITMGVMALPILRRWSFLPPLLEPDELSLNAKEIRKVLVIQLGEEDRAVLTSPFLRELRKFLPHAWIGLIVRRSTYSIFEKCPYLDEILIFDGIGIRNANKATGGPVLSWLKAILYVIGNLRRYRADMAILPVWEDAKTLTASHALMRLIGAPWRVGYLDAPAEETRSTKMLLDPPFTYGPQKILPKHEVESQLDILSFLGADVTSRNVEVWLSEEDHRYARKIMDGAGIGAADLIVALSPGKHTSTTQWPADRFIQLGRWLQEDYRAHIFVMANEGEMEAAHQIQRSLLQERTLNLSGTTTLRQMAALLKKCKMFVGTYSSLIHLAAAEGLPVIAIFGPEDYRRFGPWGAGQEVIRLDLSCGHCGNACIYDSPNCLEGIEVDQVKRIISTKLSQVQRTVQA
jgi:heptosyltransferase-2